ncbi:hypothetical protein [Demequina aurantiaca]|uniref:hypothetical protein n=1 Tax=Demequina aurantiaca TaxID=676200 RepID=UPI003D33436C
MHASDAVELGLQLVPRRVANNSMWIVLILAMFGRSDPIMWFVEDKAAGLSEYWTEGFDTGREFARADSNSVEGQRGSFALTRVLCS